MTPVKSAISVAAMLLLSAATPASSQQYEASAGGELFERVQSQFAEAYNRKDVEAMATAFSENAIRVTPSGISQGRKGHSPYFSGGHEYGASQLFSAADRIASTAGSGRQSWATSRFTDATPPSAVAKAIKSKYWETVTVAAPDK